MLGPDGDGERPTREVPSRAAVRGLRRVIWGVPWWGLKKAGIPKLWRALREVENRFHYIIRNFDKRSRMEIELIDENTRAQLINNLGEGKFVRFGFVINERNEMYLKFIEFEKAAQISKFVSDIYLTTDGADSI